MKDHGIEEGAKVQEKDGACLNCGKMIYWYALKCPRCGISVHQI